MWPPLCHGNSSLKMKFDINTLISCFHHTLISSLTASVLHLNHHYWSDSAIPNDVIEEMALVAIDRYDLKLTLEDLKRNHDDYLPLRKRVKVK
jgi:hypothetical protein